MNFVDLLGQSHAIKMGQMIIASRTPGVLIVGPTGCGKRSYAKIISEGLGGKGAKYTDIPDTVYGDWSIISPTNPDRHDWGRLVGLMDENPKHCFMVVMNGLEGIPRGVQSRCVRVVLRAIPISDLIAFSENFMVQREVSYDKGCLETVVHACNGDIRELKSVLGLALAFGVLDETFLASLTPTLPKLVREFYTHLVDGYFPEAKQVAQEACHFYSPTQFAREVLNFYGAIWSGSTILGDRVKSRFPYIGKTTDCLLRWIKVRTNTGDTLGPLLTEELNSTGTPLEDPRVVEARRAAEALKAESMLRGRPELNLDPTTISNRKNPDVPIYEDKSIPMDPRVRQRLKEEAEYQEKQAKKSGFLTPSSVISVDAMGDMNPFGVRMPSPKQIPSGVVLPSSFAKRTKARKLEAHEKWDITYKEKAQREEERAHIVSKVKGVGCILTEDNQGMTLVLPSPLAEELIEEGVAEVC